MRLCNIGRNVLKISDFTKRFHRPTVGKEQSKSIIDGNGEENTK